MQLFQDSLILGILPKLSSKDNIIMLIILRSCFKVIFIVNQVLMWFIINPQLELQVTNKDEVIDKQSKASHLKSHHQNSKTLPLIFLSTMKIQHWGNIRKFYQSM